MLLQGFLIFLKLHDFHLEALHLQGVDRDLLGQFMQVNLLFGFVAGSRFFGYGSRSGSVPGGGRRGALLGSIALGSGAEVFLEANLLGGGRLRRSTFGLLALDVGFRGRGARSRRRGVLPRAGGSDWVLRPSLGILRSSAVAAELELGGKGDRGEDSCDCEGGSH